MGDPSARRTPLERRAALVRTARLPLVSGKTSTAVLVACLVLTALLILPLARRFPPWIDVEIVLGLWWLVWVMVLTRLLYSGSRVTDDHTLGEPRNWWSAWSNSSPRERGSGLPDWGWWFVPVFDFEGCLLGLGVILALGLVLVGLWLFIEIVIPGLAFVMYVFIRGMLARAANDEHGCRDHLPRAVLWGMLWATVYTAPLALLVWLVHVLHANSIAS